MTAVESSRADVGASPRPEKKQIKKIQVDENLAIHELNSSTEIHDEDSDGKKREKRVNVKYWGFSGVIYTFFNRRRKSIRVMMMIIGNFLFFTFSEKFQRRPRSRSQRALDFKKNEIGEVIYKGNIYCYQ